MPLLQQCIKSCNMKTRWEGNYVIFRCSGHNDINNSNINNMFDTHKTLLIILITHRLVKGSWVGVVVKALRY